MKLSDDLLHGVKAIAVEIDKSVPATYRLAASGQIPTFKLGGRITARRSELREAMSAKAHAA